jgi:aerobic carbon-monoxide dehydrogenase small subunit
MIRKRPITLTVNGSTYAHDIEPRRLLTDFLREDLGLTGTHVGCEHGVCGACTVLLDGTSARACLCLAVQADGREVMTVEGMGEIGALSLLQEKFRKHHALQCGFCTPGMLATAHEILSDAAPLTDAEIREALSGNLCRCTGYEHIVRAVSEALDERLGSTATGSALNAG